MDQAARLQFTIGDGLDLWLDDRRLGARQDDRDIAVPLTGEGIPEELVAVRVRGQIGLLPIDETYTPAPNLVFRHVWDGTSAERDAPGAPANITTELAVGWELEEKFPRPARTMWWKQPVVAGGIDLRHLGCGGVTPDAVHHLHLATDTLWRGDGSRRVNAQAQAPRHLARLKVGPRELVVADGDYAHVFDSSGHFKRTLSVDRGHSVASAHTDETGRITSWERLGHRYTIDRRNDTEAMLRSPAGVWAVIDFDERGRAVRITDQDKLTATLEYTTTGGLARVVDSTGLVTQIERDDLGRVVQFGDSTGRQLQLTRTEFESGSEVRVVTAEGRETVHRTERLADGSYVQSRSLQGATNLEELEHRSLGSLGDEQILRTPSGVVVATRHSSHSDHKRAVEVSRASFVTPFGKTRNVERRVERHRDGSTVETISAGHTSVRTRIDPESHSVTTRTAEGRKASSQLIPQESLKVEIPGAGTMKIEFDPYGRPRRRGLQGELLTFGYDQNGRLTWIDFERWRQHLHHDEQGRVVALETPDGWLQIARDAAGRVSAVQTPTDSVTHLHRRADGALASIQYPLVGKTSQVEEMVYDRDGLLIAQVYSTDHYVGYERDETGRVARIVAPQVKVSVEYDDATGQIAEVSSSEGDHVRFLYDGDLPWCEEASGQSPGRIERAFDDNYQVSAQRINNAHDVNITRDRDGLLRSVGPLQIDRSSNAGLMVGLRLGGLTSSREYDDVGRLKRQETLFGRMAAVFFVEEIERDEFGRIQRVAERTDSGERMIEYTYNEARRLEEVRVNGTVTMSLEQDANGNLVQIRRNGRALQLSVDAADRLASVAGQPTSHDDAGNLTEIGSDGAVRRYRYDGLGRFVGSADPRHDVTHVLDPIGRPIAITGPSGTQRFLWDRDRLVATLDPAGNVDIRFIDSRANAAPEGLIRDGVPYLLIADHLGSVRVVVNASDGTVVQSVTYDALGRPTTNTAPGWQPFGFAGGLHETASGVVRFRRRTYDPFVGRFISRDPLGFAGGQVNLYQYALGDPINNVDPTGMVVGPSGELHAYLGDFISARPLTADHAYMQTRDWTQETTPLTTLGRLGDLMSSWDAGIHPSHIHCSQAVGNVPDAWCYNATHIASSPAVRAERFITSAALPTAWEFDGTRWQNTAGLASMAARLGRLPESIKRLRPTIRDTLSTAVDTCLE